MGGVVSVQYCHAAPLTGTVDIAALPPQVLAHQHRKACLYRIGSPRLEVVYTVTPPKSNKTNIWCCLFK